MRRPYARQTTSRASTDPHTALKEKLESAPYRFIADEYNSGNRVVYEKFDAYVLLAM